ncbi:polyhydroxybutyrate depolymerase [Ruegeria conchae]|uniref:alpha/beta hydrolase family esterase n=1 Tax=Ruegeria conchae TaxID=981384 RepID=UPI0021A93065|nr:polyhydroxybutyrate depolymerase [Ruegeria conchae]UWR03165.1 polyhydroxybutyrate depolymerase [Ruegeria conchae]
MHNKVMAVFVLLVSSGQAVALDCGDKTKSCKIETGEYHIVLPDDWQGGPAVMHLHGYGGTGEKIVGNTAFVEEFTKRGYAFIAPTALPWLDGKPTDWSVRDGWNTYPRSDARFLREVLADAALHANVNVGRVLLTGFSRGGSMAWEVACHAPDLALGYAPASGGFWLPATEDCLKPVHLLHTHGFADKVVPLEGRAIHSEEFDVTITQADIWQGLSMWRQENKCPPNAAHHEMTEGLWRKRWNCEYGSLEIILHDGGHGYPKGWSSIALDWFESLEN